MNQIKLGTIGSGFIVHYILKGVKATEGICLEAVYSRTEEKGRELAGKYGAKKVYTDLDALLSDKEVNFIYVASPNNMHYEQARAALLQGKNVICEKPMCPRKVEAEELIALAEERGLLLIDATPTAFLPNLSIIKEKLPAYYDENRICLYTDGLFEMNLPGLPLNNRNWGKILKAGRIWAVTILLGYPVISYVEALLFTGILRDIVDLPLTLLLTLGGFFVPIYIAGRRNL